MMLFTLVWLLLGDLVLGCCVVWLCFGVWFCLIYGACGRLFSVLLALCDTFGLVVYVLWFVVC